MQQEPSCENNSSDVKEVPRLFYNKKLQYRATRSQPHSPV